MATGKFERIRSWLCASDPSINHNKALQQRHGGSGKWFIQSQAFTSFKQGDLPFLWLNGIPGCGKTILSSSIIEDLEQGSLDTPPAILYFYFDFNDKRKRRLDDAVRSLVWQASSHGRTQMEEIARLYATCRDGGIQPSTDAIVQTLAKTLETMDHVMIVFDAMDECTTRSALLPWLARLADQEFGNVKTIVTSRREHDIQVEFEKWLRGDAIVPLQKLDVDPDIRAYVRAMLQTSPQLQRWRLQPGVQGEIETALMSKANGM
jgi:hypothetical protein